MYYIDFDNTLYETGRLTKDVLTTFAKLIGKLKQIDPSIVLDELKATFNSSVDNFENFANWLSAKYGLNNNILQSHLKKIIIDNGSSYVFPDALNFLKRLRDEGETVCILKNHEQQMSKLQGSGILQYVSDICCTTRYKYELEIDYSNGIFIDDSPRDLEGLYRAGVKKLIRIKKPSNVKRTSKELNIPEEIPTYTSFDDIDIEKLR